jgi:catechol 2,3-dioxygenase-like lactoylglutathione lyase family enzyme
MKVPFTIGTVGHFGLAVRDPQRSAEWFTRVLGLRKEFEFEGGVAVGNDNVTIALSLDLISSIRLLTGPAYSLGRRNIHLDGVQDRMVCSS